MEGAFSPSLSGVLRAWRIVLRLAFLIYYITILSYRLCFLENLDIFSDSKVGFIFFDYFVDAFFILDLAILLKCGGFSPPVIAISFDSNTASSSRGEKQVVPESSALSQQGAACFKAQDGLGYPDEQRNNSWLLGAWGSILLVFQIALVFPFEVIAYAAGFEGYRWLQLFRCLRVVYFPLYWKQLTELMEASKLVQSAGLYRIALISLIMALVGHVSACIFYQIALEEMRRYGNSNTWLFHDNLASIAPDGEVVLHRPLSYRFLRAMYWSFQTISSVAFGDIAAYSEPETWYCIAYFYLTGICVYVSVANLIMVITNFDAARNENLRKIAKFNKYATYRRLPAELTNRVRSYYAYQWQLLKGVDENRVSITSIYHLDICLLCFYADFC